MTLADFYEDVEDIVHESDDISGLIRRSARAAARWIERQWSFQYMKTTSYHQFTFLSSSDKGILLAGKRLKRIIGPVSICDATDRRKVLRKVTRLMSDDTSPTDESWDPSKVGSVPGGYFILGRAENVAPYMIVGMTVADDEWILRFRPIPDKMYFVLIESYRYSELPTDETKTHWLVDEAYGLLLARTIYELAPGLKDRELGGVYAERIGGELAAAKAADIELEESDADEAMRYDSDFQSDR